MSHIPVMLDEVLESLSPVDGGVYVDGTFGAGGYARAILEAADCVVVAIDRDPDAEARAQTLKEEFGDRLVFVRGCFGDVRALLRNAGYEAVDGFVLDIGVSSFQIDDAARGFSFRADGPLDMRMDYAAGQSAADLVNEAPEEDLANIIYRYGEERHSRRVAKAIVMRRAEEAFARTGDFADVVRAALPKARGGKIDPATRTFQALRIAVNDELGELERALEASKVVLNNGGRLVVVSFHSLEDRIVKQFLRAHSSHEKGGSRLLPGEQEPEVNLFFDVPSRRASKPTNEECVENSRSRSARLRWAIRKDCAT